MASESTAGDEEWNNDPNCAVQQLLTIQIVQFNNDPNFNARVFFVVFLLSGARVIDPFCFCAEEGVD